MNTATPKSGWIEVICGPMFSGKTEELIRRLRRSYAAKRAVQVFKPVLDTRYSETEIVTHNGVRMRAEPVRSAGEITTRLRPETSVIGIDEVHFFGEELVPAANDLANSGRGVLVAGLDTDYLGRPFAPLPDLLALAESITKLPGICARCGAPAKHSQRLIESDDLLFVGAGDAYEARCRACFEPGVSHQEVLDFAASAVAGERSAIR